MKHFALVVGLLVLVACAAYAETDTASHSFNVAVAEVAEISVNATAFTLTIDNPATGGNQPADVSDSSTYVCYTSINSQDNSGTAVRAIDAALTAGAVPAGCDLVVSGGDTLVGSAAIGKVGTGATGGEIGTSAATVVSGIGNCWTGTAVGATVPAVVVADGNPLTYTLKVDPTLSLIHI